VVELAWVPASLQLADCGTKNLGRVLLFEDYFRDIMSPYFEFQKFNSCCRLIHLGGVKF